MYGFKVKYTFKAKYASLNELYVF